MLSKESMVVCAFRTLFISVSCLLSGFTFFNHSQNSLEQGPHILFRNEIARGQEKIKTALRTRITSTKAHKSSTLLPSPKQQCCIEKQPGKMPLRFYRDDVGMANQILANVRHQIWKKQRDCIHKHFLQIHRRRHQLSQ